ncbi:TetR/AcrR family transcriptional regulator [Sphingobium abikonense]|uniref:TetR/AcrR family transcriptional regulator n=1 Tax=Sphingobium abikonense TaxID=86193 RepID=UPI0007885BB6|nr:TetR/AcrR family transcriptional regulator [Sphingobium abikonense]
MTASKEPVSGSRREARKRDRQEMILEVAQRYFLDHGYAGTTMSGIAAALGGSKGTLWNHFPSKDALFSAVLDRVAQAYRTRLSKILDPDAGLEEVLRGACVSLVAKVTSPEAIALHRLVISEGGRFPELSRIFFELAPRNTRALLADFLEQAMRRGALRKANALDAARALMALCMAGIHHQLLMGQITQFEPEDIDRDAAFAVDLFLRAYAPDSRPATSI